MLLEKMFGNTWGYIWLILFIVVILALLVFILVKKDKVSEAIIEKEEVVDNKEEVEDSIKEIKESSEEIKKEEAKKEVKEDKKEKSKKKDYGEFEIVSSDDGFFRVKKIGSERALRKFSTFIEAENYIEKRGLSND